MKKFHYILAFFEAVITAVGTLAVLALAQFFDAAQRLMDKNAFLYLFIAVIVGVAEYRIVVNRFKRAIGVKK